MNQKISIVGMGYVGCGNALMLAKNNLVSIVDIDEQKVDHFNNMQLPIFDELDQELKDRDHKSQQDIYLNAGIKWSLENPGKTLELAWINLRNFITPGYNFFHHPFNLWLLTFVISLPVFIMAYLEIARKLFTKPYDHLVIASIFLGMLSVALIFYAQNRFRATTIEPYYLMYACSFAVLLFERKIKLPFIK